MDAPDLESIQIHSHQISNEFEFWSFCNENKLNKMEMMDLNEELYESDNITQRTYNDIAKRIHSKKCECIIL